MKLEWNKESVQLVWMDSLFFQEYTWSFEWHRWWVLARWSKWNYICLNWIGREDAYWGYEEIWYDGPWYSFGLGLFNVSWDFT